MTRGPLAARATALCLTALAVLGTVLAAPRAVADPPTPEPGRPWFGPALLYPGDTPAAYVERLGAVPAMYTLPVPYPLDEGAVSQLDQFARLLAEQGAVLLLDVQPQRRLGRLRDDDATLLAEQLAALHDELGLRVLVRFAPEMNGSWERWGQQPGAYVGAFRQLAEAVRAVDADDAWASMVWAPVYGSGYPFRDPDRTQGALDEVAARERGRWDTNDNGRLDPGDDPYGPYYPGAEWVDWVGLSMYRLGQSQGTRRNRVPPATEFRQRLQETWGYGDGSGGDPFYERFARADDRPMLVETAAFFNPAYPGADERAVKRAWWRQVFGALDDYPLVAGISWLEVSRAEPEALQDEPVDWRVTHRPAMARAFAAALAGAPVTLGPVTEPVSPEPSPPPAADPESPASTDVPPRDAPAAAAASSDTPWLVGGAAALLVALLAGLAVPSWRQRELPVRDPTLDLLRGGLLLAMAGSVVAVAGAGAVSALDSRLVATGTALLLLVSGASHAVRHADLAARLGAWAAGITRVRRARTVYVAAVLTSVLALAVEALPRVPAPLGSYDAAQHLLDYPPPGWAVGDFLALTAAPWLVATLGLVAFLVLVSPLVLAALRRGGWWVVVALSWALYAVGVRTDAELLPLAVEASLPVLAWQVPFVHGLVLGHHRAAVAGLLRRAWVLALLALAATAYAVVVGVDLLPDHEPPTAAVVGVVAVAVLVLVSTCWRPVSAVLARLTTPVGRAPLLAVPTTVVATVLVAWLDLDPGAARWAAVAAAVVALWLLALAWGRLSRGGDARGAR